MLKTCRAAVKSTTIDLVTALAGFVYPDRCCACDQAFYPPATGTGSPSGSQRPRIVKRDVDFSEVMAPFLCLECVTAFTEVDSPMCVTCGMVFKSRQAEDHVCGECHRNPKFFRSARAVGIYEQSLLKAVQKLKYNGWTGLARPLGELLLSGLRRWRRLPDIDLIVPVPLYPRKLRQRGFNQVVLMIRSWPVLFRRHQIDQPDFRITEKALVRKRETRSQTRLTKKERRENVRGAFAVKDRSVIKGRRILLIDDVYTTGATVDECARTLKAAGSGEVDVLTLARVR